MRPLGRGTIAGFCVAGLALLFYAYADSYQSLIHVWLTNSTFSHGVLIAPISLWLAWRLRGEFAATALHPSWLGVISMAALIALWMVSKGAGVIGPEHFAVVAMIPAMVLAILGVRAARVLAFPLSYLAFAVPVGHAIVPILMHATADVATWALQLTGIPVHRSNMFISIPAGRFEVARACSGLNYVVTGLALGVLYSYLTYRGWRKRLLSVTAFLVIPVAANGVRVYFTILVSHFTDMRFGPGEEHVWFGRVFFILVMLLMFWFGRRWHDEDAEPRKSNPLRSAVGGLGHGEVVVIAATLVLVLLGPWYLARATERIEQRVTVDSEKLVLPRAAGWSGPVSDPSAWRPLYSGGRAEKSGSYYLEGGGKVDVYVAVYGIGRSAGGEMISYSNKIFAEEREVLVPDRLRTVSLQDGSRQVVREQAVRDLSGGHLVWYWYLVGTRPTTDPYRTKLHEAIGFVTLGAVSERIVTLSTPLDSHAVDRLERFVATNPHCVLAGFAYEACSQ